MPQHTVKERTRARRLKELQQLSKDLGGDRHTNLEIQKLQNPKAFKDGKIKPGKRADHGGNIGAIRRHFAQLDSLKKEASK